MICPKQKSIAVIGAGVAGLTSAWLLSRRHQVDLYEKNDYLGGHTCTIRIPDGPDAGTPVDMGFIVMNERNYPLFNTVLDQLDIARHDSDMSFSFHCERSGYAYAGNNLKTLFAKKSNAIRPGHWRMIADILRFNKSSREDLNSGRLNGSTLGEYVKRKKLSRSFADQYLFAMGSAIWSAPGSEIEEFPAEPFIHFFHNHGLLTLNDRPQWKYVAGGSQEYVKVMKRTLKNRAHVKCGVKRIRRTPTGVEVFMKNGACKTYDEVVLATHADEAFALLEDPSKKETRLLGPWKYRTNEAVLHADPSVMPGVRSAWASWNFAREEKPVADTSATVTYHMNRLQNLRTQNQYFVSLNRSGRIDKNQIHHQVSFTHPGYSFDTLATQNELPDLNGENRTYFCGSYFGYGFHEDAVRSAVHAASALGVKL